MVSSSNNNLTRNIANSDINGIALDSSSSNILNSNTANSNSVSGILLSSSSNNNLTSNTANKNTEYGIHLSSSSNNILSNITANSTINYGFYLSSSSKNTLNNIMADSNLIGVYLDSSSSNNSLSNVVANSNTVYGIVIDSGSNNAIANSIVSSTGYVGIWLYSAGSSGPNYFYNNLFNNTNNIVININGTVYPNYWNTTKQIGKRIYSNGIYLGGNYYTNPSGNGYSDTCADADKDGFCDTPYTFATNNIDYLPYINIGTPPPMLNYSINFFTSTGASYTIGSWTNSSYVTVTISCTNAQNGCFPIYCTGPGNSGCTPSTTYSSPIQISTTGASYICEGAVDNAGHSLTSPGTTCQYIYINQPSTPPVAALKAGPDGYLYVPNIPNLGYMKVDLWYGSNASSLWCDQAGGTSPYSAITTWPDGKVDTNDTTFISSKFGSQEGTANWNYMADCVPDKKVDTFDVSKAASNFGKSGTYSTDLTNIKVKFNNNPSLFTPYANGTIPIPAGAVNFTVYNGPSSVMSLVTFYTVPTTQAPPQSPPPNQPPSGGSPLIRKCGPMGCAAEPVATPQTGNTWSFAVIILAIIGLGIGYFILREAMFTTATRKTKK